LTWRTRYSDVSSQYSVASASVVKSEIEAMQQRKAATRKPPSKTAHAASSTASTASTAGLYPTDSESTPSSAASVPAPKSAPLGEVAAWLASASVHLEAYTAAFEEAGLAVIEDLTDMDEVRTQRLCIFRHPL
jgi:predicted lipid-binding transport protein (Tim44 family)